MQDLRLADLVEEVVSSFKLSAKKKGLSLEASVPEDMVLQADRGMILRVFYNLVGNALKFTMEGGVSVSARPLDGHVEVQVRDTGVGIAPEHVERVFERFYHVEGPDRKAPPGTGLGLAIVQSIVEAHGGRIHVESEVGVGTTFTFTLARQQPAAS